MYTPILSSSIASGRWCLQPAPALGPCKESYLQQISYDDVPFAAMLTAPGHTVSDSRVHDRTGYSVYIMDLMWDRYKNHLGEFRPSERKKDFTKCYFILMFIWIHLKPTARNTSAMMWTEATGFISEWVRLL